MFKIIGSDTGLPLVEKYDDLPKGSIKLFTIANSKDLFVAAGKNGIVSGRLSDLRTSATNKDSQQLESSREEHKVPFEVRFLEFSSDETNLAICPIESGIHIYSTLDFRADNSQENKICSIETKKLKDIQQRPMFGSDFLVLEECGDLYLLNTPTKSYTKFASNITAVSWSKKGKQLLASTTDDGGKILQMLPDGKITVEFKGPAEADENNSVPVLLNWLSNTEILCVYASNLGPDDYEFTGYICKRPSGTSSDCEWLSIEDLCPAFGDMTRDLWMYSQVLKNYHDNIPTLIFMSSGPSSDISLLTPQKSFLIDNDAARATLPFGEDDTGPVGMALDISSTQELVNPTVSIEKCSALPILWILNNEGQLCGWHVVWESKLKESEISLEPVRAAYDKDVAEASSASSTGLSMSSTSSQSATASQSTALAQSASQPVFGQSSPSQPAFGQSSFGQSSFTKQPSFGQSSFGQSSPSQPAFGQSSFGQSSSSKPAFGQSTFGQSPSQPAFGQSTFGQPSFGKSPSQPAFGQSSFGQSASQPAFGQSARDTSGGNTPANKQSAQNTGQSAFGGFSGFGGSSAGGFASLSANNSSGVLDGDSNSEKKVESAIPKGPIGGLRDTSTRKEYNSGSEDDDAQSDKSGISDEDEDEESNSVQNSEKSHGGDDSTIGGIGSLGLGTAAAQSSFGAASSSSPFGTFKLPQGDHNKTQNPFDAGSGSFASPFAHLKTNDSQANAAEQSPSGGSGSGTGQKSSGLFGGVSKPPKAEDDSESKATHSDTMTSSKNTDDKQVFSGVFDSGFGQKPVESGVFGQKFTGSTGAGFGSGSGFGLGAGSSTKGANADNPFASLSKGQGSKWDSGLAADESKEKHDASVEPGLESGSQRETKEQESDEPVKKQQELEKPIEKKQESEQPIKEEQESEQSKEAKPTELKDQTKSSGESEKQPEIKQESLDATEAEENDNKANEGEEEVKIKDEPTEEGSNKEQGLGFNNSSKPFDNKSSSTAATTGFSFGADKEKTESGSTGFGFGFNTKNSGSTNTGFGFGSGPSLGASTATSTEPRKPFSFSTEPKVKSEEKPVSDSSQKSVDSEGSGVMVSDGYDHISDDVNSEKYADDDDYEKENDDENRGLAEEDEGEDEDEDLESEFSDDLDEEVYEVQKDLVDDPMETDAESELPTPDDPNVTPDFPRYVPMSDGLPEDIEETIISDFDQYFLETNAQFKIVHTNARNLERFTSWHSSESEAHDLTDVYQMDKWKLCDVTGVAYIVDTLLQKATKLKEEAASDDHKIEDLKKGLGSVALQISRVQELIKYKTSEVNERGLRLRSLPVNAVELQRKLRIQSGKLEQELSNVESEINLFKTQLSKYGSSQAPSAQGIRDSIGRITELAVKRYHQVQQLRRQLRPLSSSSSSNNNSTLSPRKLVESGSSSNLYDLPSTPSKSTNAGDATSMTIQTPASAYRDRAMDEIDFLSKRSETKFKTVVGDFLRERAGHDILH